MKNETISPMTRLEPGTRVQVKTHRGYVVSSYFADSPSGGRIAVNTIIFNEEFKRGFGAHGKWESIPCTDPTGVNYSFIQVL